VGTKRGTRNEKRAQLTLDTNNALTSIIQLLARIESCLRIDNQSICFKGLILDSDICMH
jgi:hypothetical protein